ncbi:MAG: nicotinamide mononucleotide transporter [Ruminococcus sp.]|nr:nicotinamide mononucleotide transporter [Ruminococcus sp.]
MIGYFTLTEKILWCSSVLLITGSFLAFGGDGVLTLIASIIGVTSLIFAAKGNPVSPALMIVFSVLYGIISYSFSYYGEMLTYLGMTAPMSVFALVSWLRNPSGKGRAQVKVNRITGGEFALILLITAAVTVFFYFVLRHFNTANLLPSTVSVATSFLAAALTFRRSPYFALAYASNDAVLILLWALAALKDISYLSVLICFLVFLVNDLYGFVSWLKMEKNQAEESSV